MTKRCSTCKENKSLAEFGVSRRYPSGINNRCKQCCRSAADRSSAKHGPYKVDPEKARARERRFHERHPEKMAEYSKRYYAANKEAVSARARANPVIKASQKRWYAANAEQVKVRTLEWKRTHKGRVNAKNKAYRDADPARAKRYRDNWMARNPGLKALKARAWRAAHPHLVAANVALRRAAKLSATPAWANAFFMREAYHLAKLRAKATGFAWHVDHIVPLQSPHVCGLHVECNLRVIPAVENARKGNKLIPEAIHA